MSTPHRTSPARTLAADYHQQAAGHLRAARDLLGTAAEHLRSAEQHQEIAEAQQLAARRLLADQPVEVAA